MTSTTKQRTNGGMNRLAPEDRAVHDWYRFVLSFPPHLVRDYVARFRLDRQGYVLDPFCGTGTTLVECKKLGIPSVGFEANPVAQFASRVKLDWTPDPDALIEHARQVGEKASCELRSVGIEDVAIFAQNSGVHQRSLRTLPGESMKLLLANSISPLPLHKTLVLQDRMVQALDSRYRNHELLALAKALVYSISNLHFGPEVGVGAAKADAPVVAPWLAEVRTMSDDLRIFGAKQQTPATVHLGDARHDLTMLEPGSISGVITSPPYPNEKDYTRTTRLESVILGLITSRAELQALKRGLVRSNTRGVYKDDGDDSWVADHPEIQRIAAAIETRRLELGKTSGFERLYAKVTKLYFGGMAQHFTQLRGVLRPGAYLAYVVGDQASYLRVMIRTGNLRAALCLIERATGKRHNTGALLNTSSSLTTLRGPRASNLNGKPLSKLHRS